MEAEGKRAGGVQGNGRLNAYLVDIIGVYVDAMAERLEQAAETMEGSDAMHVLAAARMLRGIDETVNPEAYLKAVHWTVEQVRIELSEVMRD